MTRGVTQRTSRSRKSSVGSSAYLTLIEHLREVRIRLFWIVSCIVIVTSIGYTIQNHIIAFLMHPLGSQKLVYLTPIGGFNFIFKVALYFGIVVSIPVIIYQLYRFLEPLMGRQYKKSVLFYLFASVALAAIGVSFAYFVTLPASLRFLTDFNIERVSAMLTVDSYLSFVVTYVLGFAALFQIPLLLLIINSITPLPPKKLMGFQRYVILAAFVLAAVISPTPDITNQTILAIPIVIMYQLGVFAVWLQSRTKSKKQRSVKPAQTVATPAPVPISQPQPLRAPASMTATITPPVMQQAAAAHKPRLVMDVTHRAQPRADMHRAAYRPLVSTARKQIQFSSRSRQQPLQNSRRPTASVDGIMRYAPGV